MLTTVSLIVLLSFIDRPNQTSIPAREWIIAPRFLTLQEGVTKAEAREWMETEYLPLYRYYYGWNATLGEPISSGSWTTPNNNAKEKGDFVLIYTFDNVDTRDYYFPAGKDWRNQEVISKVLKEHQSTIDQLFGKYFVQDKYQNEEYLMFASAK